MKHFLLPLFLFALILSQPHKAGDIVLIGGGEIPKEISEYKGSYIVVTTNIAYAMEVWPNILKVKKIIYPEQLCYSDIVGLAGIVICGGDQWHYLNRLDAAVVQYAYERGLHIIGTSAGAMILGEYYFSAEKGGITSNEACCGVNVCLGRNFVRLSPLKGCIVDSHYSNRQREGRLKVFVEKSGASLGLGIDEATALIYSGDKTRVVGIGTVGKIFGEKSPESY